MYLAATLVVLGGVVIAIKLYRQYTQAPYQVTVISVENVSGTGVTVTFDVTTPPGKGATCTVQGHTRDGELVGQANVDVPPGGPDQTTYRVTYALVTTKKPVTGEVPGCGPTR
jgi:hypothetical protein